MYLAKCDYIFSLVQLSMIHFNKISLIFGLWLISLVVIFNIYSFSVFKNKLHRIINVYEVIIVDKYSFSLTSTMFSMFNGIILSITN